MFESSHEFRAFYRLVNDQCKGLVWRRQTRLRVTEHLLGLPYCSITSSKQAAGYGMTVFLQHAYPEYINNVPPPEKLKQQIRAICQHYSNVLVQELGNPRNMPEMIQA